MKYLLTFIVLLYSLTGLGQSGPVRVEFEAPVNSDIYRLVPCGERGVLSFYETKDLAGEESKNWFFILFDTNLTEIWKAHIPVITGAEFQDYLLADSVLSLFFLNTGKVRTGKDNFQFLIIDLVNGISMEKRGLFPVESAFKKMVVQGQRAYLALNLKNDQAAVYTVDLVTSEIIDFNIVLPDQNTIEDLVYDPYQQQVLVLVSNFLSRKQEKTYLLSLAPEGTYRYDMEISTSLGSKYLNAARIFPMPDSTFMVIGTYGSLASKLPSTSDYFGIESAGVFSTRIKGRKQEFMNYFNFMEFRNLRAGVSARDFYRLPKKKVRESAEYSLNYELLAHDPVFHDSSLVILLEAFYPEFRTVSDMAYDYWGRPVTHTYTVFEGYRFFNSILAAFNLKGDLVWDNSIEVNLPLTRRLEKRTSFFFDDQPVLLFYNDGSRISYRVGLKHKELVPFSKLSLETTEIGDRVTATGFSQVRHWYGHYFLAYGYHTIRNNSLVNRNERTVFYINKISLE